MAIASFFSEVWAEESRPNILLITVDNLRPDHLGCYGYSRNTSPFLDKLASRGVLFKEFYAQSSWTNPGMFSLLTGLYPPAHRMDHKGAALLPGIQTLPKLLRQYGYHAPAVSYLSYSMEYRNAGFEREKNPQQNLRSIEGMETVLESQGQEPFFFWFHYKGTHLPYNPPSDTLKHFRTEPLPCGPGIKAVQSSQVVEMDSVVFSEAEKQAVVDLYDGQVLQFDRDLERLFEVLKNRGLDDRTLVIITADHGEELFEHGFVGHASTSGQARLYEEFLRVPLLMIFPGMLPWNQVVSGIGQQVDLLPTILDLLQVPVPKTVQGISLVDAIHNGKTGQDKTYAASLSAGYRSTGEQKRIRLRSMRHGKWKLIARLTPDGDEYELYDLRRDPLEKSNLAFRRKATLRKMKRQFLLWADQCHDSYLDSLYNE